MREIELKLVAEPQHEGGIRYSFQDEDGNEVKFKGNVRAEVDLQPTEIFSRLGVDADVTYYYVGITLQLPLEWKGYALTRS